MSDAGAALQVVAVGDRTRFLVVLGSFAVTAVLGLLVAYRAYQGYRRNRSEPMLYLAVGLVLVTAVPPLLSLVLSNATALAGWLVVLAMTASQTAGLVSILYSLYGDFRTNASRRAPRP
ncbi:MAG: hypothetical protein ABEJ61_00795 [Haloferacaceae archaeon]